MNLTKPKALKKGDTIAILSTSSGMAGDDAFLFRYEIGKKRLHEVFGLNAIEYPTTLAGTEYVYNHPEKRAEDLMAAFQNPEVKAIFSCIGGEESIRLLPYINFDVIKNNPKIFMGYSDNTIIHFMCMKAGVSSVYGPAILPEFAENIEIFPYTTASVEKTLFQALPIGEITPSPVFSRELIWWTPENQNTQKPTEPNPAPVLLQGEGIVQGHLIGGCMEVIEFMRGTPLFPDIEMFEDAILFLETSEEAPSEVMLARWLRGYAAMGILHRIKGIVFGKPYTAELEEPYMKTLKKVLTDELGLSSLPVLYGLNFGHTEPMFCIPYGAKAEIDCGKATFSILESAVV